QDAPDPAPHTCLLVGDHDPRRTWGPARALPPACLGGRVPRLIAHAETSWNPAGPGAIFSALACSRGIVARTRHPPPGRGPASIEPPEIAIRSRRPMGPRPLLLPRPVPGPVGASLATSTRRSCTRYSMRTAVCAWSACLITLVSASWATR